MTQIARNLTMADVGFLVDHRYLIHDRDGKYCPAFDGTLTDGAVTPVAPMSFLTTRAPAVLERPEKAPTVLRSMWDKRWVRSSVYLLSDLFIISYKHYVTDREESHPVL